MTRKEEILSIHSRIKNNVVLNTEWEKWIENFRQRVTHAIYEDEVVSDEY